MITPKQFVESIPSTAGPAMPLYPVDTHVKLEDMKDFPQESGVVLSYDWNDIELTYYYVVEVYEKFKTDHTDDRLRELSEDQIVGVERHNG